MVLLDRLLEHDNDRTTARVVVASQQWLRRVDGSVPAWLALEYMAQCAAAHETLRMGAEGRVVRGFVVAVRELRFGAQRFEADAVLRVQTRRVGGRPGLGGLSHACSIHAEAAEGGSLPLAEGRVTIALERSQSVLAPRGPV
jgi:predicted hotdog family 3-hydroxylacyl-ACP dehydratase